LRNYLSCILANRNWIITLLLFSITFLIYISSLENGFVWDDDSYVVKNVHIHSLNIQSLYWMLTEFHSGNWHPLAWFSHALDCSLWGLSPCKHHLTIRAIINEKVSKMPKVS
jgi:hypothetical protein